MKKANALLSLITALLMMAHIGYTSYAYLTMYYNPFLTNLISYSFMVCVCLHAILGMMSVFLNSDGTKLNKYPGYNKATIVQRVTAALIFPLVFIHVNTFKYMQASAEAGRSWIIILLMVSEILLFATVLAHFAVSFSRALVILGWLKSAEKQKRIDKACIVICSLILVFASFAVVRGQIMMFMS